MVINFGKYVLLHKIATGGMAEIWIAKQTGVEGFEKLVVIKKILPHFTDNKEFIDMFLNEARVAAKLNHPNVVQIYDLGKQDNIYYIAMEYISGADIKDILTTSIKKEKFLPLSFSVNIISQAAEGLYYAHTLKDIYGTSMDIVHRDISPQNILVTYSGSVKIVDFGIAKASTTSQETRAGVLKGKFSYMSPEQALGKELDGRSDIFALGIILYEITVGRRLFKSDSELKTLKMITEERIVPPIEINSRYPKRLNDIIMKSLEKDPDKRYNTAREMRLDLDEFLKNYPKPSSNLELSSWMRDIFEEKIKETKTKHEKLLREEPDENLLSEILAEQEKKEPTSTGEFSKLSSIFTNSNQSLFELTRNTNTSNSYRKLDNTNSKKKSSNNKKPKTILILIIVLIITSAVAIFFNIDKLKSKTCPIGYTGSNCDFCVKNYQKIKGYCVKKCPLAYTGDKCDKCAKGYQDNDLNGSCKKSCNHSSIKCKSCNDSSGKVICLDEEKAEFEIPITSNPIFAKLVINNKKLANSTNTIYSFKKGKKYDVIIMKEGYQQIVKSFTFNNNIDKLNFELKKVEAGYTKLNFTLKPQNAKILLDSKKVIINNLTKKNYISQGEHILEITKEGYKTYKSKISVTSKNPIKLDVILEKIDSKKE